jgi:hypothetical protein
VELCCWWIRRNPRIKRVFGTTDSAVKTEVWIAVCVYTPAAVVRKAPGLELSLPQILQVLRVNVFEQMPWRKSLPKRHRKMKGLIQTTNVDSTCFNRMLASLHGGWGVG